MLYGSVMTFDDTKVIDLVDKAGARLVADALCTGSRFWRKDVALEGPLIDGLVERYLHNIPCPNMTDLAMRLNYVIAKARESKAEGLIYYNLIL
jgi:benzoyl-CoA reductase/2-hydroxyglutaryl-CoA dehydratase subunit BcrC/BadD/HgdB